MPQVRTVGEFLEQQNIQLAIEPDDPLLSTPFDIFDEEDHLELPSFLWLYSKKFLTPAKLPNPVPRIPDPTYTEILRFYYAVYNNLEKASTTTAQTEPPKPFWVNATQITCFLHNTNVYKKLFGDPEITAQKTENMLPKQNTEKPIPIVVSRALNHSQNRRRHSPHPHKYQPSKLATAATSAQHMLQTVLSSLQVTIPKEVQPDLQHILLHDLKQINGLTQEKTPEFIFYILLFLFKLARANQSMSHCYYADDVLANRLGEEARTQGQAIKAYLEHSDPNKPIDWPIVLEEQLINSALKINNQMLALLCFRNCPILKTLFINSWNELKINPDIQSIQEIEIHSYDNYFVFGATINSTIPGEKFTINANDFIQLSELIALAENRKTSNYSFFSPERAQEEERFKELRAKIVDKALHASLGSLPEVELFKFKLLINYSAAIPFFLKHHIQTNEYKFPKHHLLSDFTTLFMPNKYALQQFIKELINYKQVINLTDTKSLMRQMEQVKQKLEVLEQFEVKVPTDVRLDWISLQKDIWQQLKAALDNALTILEIDTEDRPELFAQP